MASAERSQMERGVAGRDLGQPLDRGETSPSLNRRRLMLRLLKGGATALAAAIGGGGDLMNGGLAGAVSAASTDQTSKGSTRRFRYGMVIDTRRCVGCKACTVACKAENKTPPGVSYAVVTEQAIGNRPDDKPIFMTKPCFQCERPPCVDVCPVSATFKRAADGIVVVAHRGLHPARRHACVRVAHAA